MARPTVAAWAACGVLTLAGSLTVGGVAAAKSGKSTPPGKAAAIQPVLSLPANAPGEQTALPSAANAAESAEGSKGGSISRLDLATFAAARSAALKAKDRSAFTGTVDPKDPDLVKKQGQLYDNLEKIPFTTASYSVQKVDDGESTFAQGAEAKVTISFNHQITGVDSVPVVESYQWTVVRGADGLLLTSVDAPTRRHGYPAPWDSVPNLTVLTRKHVVIMADDTSSSFAKSRADSMETDAEYDYAHWTGGSGTAPGFAVFLTSNRTTYESIYSQGRDNSVGVTVPMPVAPSGTGPDGSAQYPGSRIAIDTSQYKNINPADADIVFRHEMTHAMIDPFEDLTSQTGQDHVWVVEGFAEWESQRMYSPSELLYDGSSLHNYASKHGAPKALPTDDQVYSSDSGTQSLGYFYSHMAIRYMAQKWSPEKVDQFVLYVYRHATSGSCVDDAMKTVLGTTTDQFTQGYAAWFRSAV